MPNSAAAGAESPPANPSGKGRPASSGNSSRDSGSGRQTARSTTQGRGASGASAAAAAQAASQGTAAQAATDFSAALAQSLAATPAGGGATTDTPSGNTTAKSDAESSSQPATRDSASDPVASALSLLEQALAGALAGVPATPTAAGTSGASTSTSAAAHSGAVAVDGQSGSAALSAALTQTLATDPKAGATDPNARGANANTGVSSPNPAASAAAPAAAASTAAAGLTAAAQLSSGSHTGVPGAIDSSRMTLASPVGTSAWTEELGTKVTWMAHQGIESASLQLSPEHLGPLQVTISVHEGQASVWFGAAQPDTRTALQQSLPQLRQLFAGQGLTLADAGVSREPPRGQGRQDSTRPGTSVSGITAVNLEASGTRTATAGGLGLLDTYV